MPTRYLKESICTSPNLSRVSHGAARLYFHLITRADDYGRFDAAPKVILGGCFPQIEGITIEEIQAWLGELSRHKALRFYKITGRSYGYFPTWEKHQGKPRAKASKFPAPAHNLRASGRKVRASASSLPTNRGHASPVVRSSISKSISSSDQDLVSPEQARAQIRESLHLGRVS